MPALETASLAGLPHGNSACIGPALIEEIARYANEHFFANIGRPSGLLLIVQGAGIKPIVEFGWCGSSSLALGLGIWVQTKDLWDSA